MITLSKSSKPVDFSSGFNFFIFMLWQMQSLNRDTPFSP